MMSDSSKTNARFVFPKLPPLPLLSALPPGGDWLRSLAQWAQPPAWLQHELQNRLVLFLNHVLMSEPQAQERLRRQSGRVLRLVGEPFELVLKPTPAGLLELVPLTGVQPTPDLVIRVDTQRPEQLVQAVVAGQKPSVSIEGDVQLAAEVGWLVEHVRWDVEEDLSRLLGDVPAHHVSRLAQMAWTGLRGLLASISSGSSPTTAHPPAGGHMPSQA